MTAPVSFEITALDIDQIATAEGRVVLFSDGSDKLDQIARRINKLTRGALGRGVTSDAFGKLKPGEAMELAWPVGMAASAVQVLRLDRRPDAAAARKAGAAIGRARNGKDLLLLGGNLKNLHEVMLGIALRDYAFVDHKSKGNEAPDGNVVVMAAKPEGLADAAAAVPASQP